MILELSLRWPFVRRRRDLELFWRGTSPTNWATPAGVPASAHLSWVKNLESNVRGWIHHHESDGFVIELENGGLVKWLRSEFENIEAPK